MGALCLTVRQQRGAKDRTGQDRTGRGMPRNCLGPARRAKPSPSESGHVAAGSRRRSSRPVTSVRTQLETPSSGACDSLAGWHAPACLFGGSRRLAVRCGALRCFAAWLGVEAAIWSPADASICSPGCRKAAVLLETSRPGVRAWAVPKPRPKSKQQMHACSQLVCTRPGRLWARPTRGASEAGPRPSLGKWSRQAGR